MNQLQVLKLISDATISYQEMHGTLKYFLHVLKKKNKITADQANDVLYKLDFLTQGILIHVALADEIFHENEKLFIEEITHYTDIMAYLTNETGFEFTWDDFMFADEDSRASLLEAVDDVVDTLCDTVVYSIALASIETDGEFFNTFITELTTIITAFVNVDGEYGSDEDLVIRTTIEKLLLKPFNSFIEQMNNN